MHLLRTTSTSLLGATLIATAAAAQDQRLDRLDPSVRPLVASVIDSARAAGLPTEPLVQRALEGATKGAPSEVIVGAVQRLVADLGEARSALGPGTTPPEPAAGAATLRAGAGPAVLAKLRRARSQTITVPLAVLADLVASGVPVDSAAAAVLALASTTRDADLVEFRRAVERDIGLGAPPAAAASVRVNGAASQARPGPP